MDSPLRSGGQAHNVAQPAQAHPGTQVDSPQRRLPGSHLSQSISPSASMSSVNSGLAAAPWADGSEDVPSGMPTGGAVAGGAAAGISGLPRERGTGATVPAPHGGPFDSTRSAHQEQEVLRDASTLAHHPGPRTSSIGAVEPQGQAPHGAGLQDRHNEVYGSAFGGGRSYDKNSPASASTETFGIPGGLERSHARTDSGVPQHAANTTASGGGAGFKCGDTNPFGVDLVIPYDISGDKSHEPEIEAGYKRLTDALTSAGLRIATRRGKGKAKGQEEVWVFVGASDGKVQELVEREQ